jgi:ceramide glucosyltransferase
MDALLEIVLNLLVAGSLAGVSYLLAATYAVRGFRPDRRSAVPSHPRPPITILKPVCGDEPGLYENLRSFCEQDYPAVQVVFGARDPGDSAVPVVQRLIRDLPDADLSLVVAEWPHAMNQKVGNLINMMQVARHGVLVVADSDIRVRRDYLNHITHPLADPSVGVVTCLYAGRPRRGLWSAFGAMSINFGFLPSVLVGRLMGVVDGCFGATILLRRAVLDRVGGFAAFSDQLADDFALGEAVRALGWRVHLSRHVVDNMAWEPGFRTLFQHELRWARTIRGITPFGHALSVITLPVALSFIAMTFSANAAGAILFAATCACRLLHIRTTERVLGLDPVSTWLIPLRDLLSMLVLVTSFCGRKVVWRDQQFRAGADGRVLMERSSR